MSNYGRNFEFRVAPVSKDRSGRNFLDGDAVPIGAPIAYGTGGTLGTENELGLRPFVLAADGASAPLPGQGGVAVYEFGPAAFAGDDVMLTTYSDKDMVPAGAAVQVVGGEYVKVVLRNVPAFTFSTVRGYTGRNMIEPTEALALVVGESLIPGAGDDVNGYWKSGGVADVATPAGTWLIVERVGTFDIHGETGVEIEARLNF